MNIGEFLLRTHKIATETYPAMLAMADYEEEEFVGVICAMIKTYATGHDSNKVDISKRICKRLERDDEK